MALSQLSTLFLVWLGPSLDLSTLDRDKGLIKVLLRSTALNRLRVVNIINSLVVEPTASGILLEIQISKQIELLAWPRLLVHVNMLLLGWWVSVRAVLVPSEGVEGGCSLLSSLVTGQDLLGGAGSDKPLSSSMEPLEVLWCQVAQSKLIRLSPGHHLELLLLLSVV